MKKTKILKVVSNSVVVSHEFLRQHQLSHLIAQADPSAWMTNKSVYISKNAFIKNIEPTLLQSGYTTITYKSAGTRIKYKYSRASYDQTFIDYPLQHGDIVKIVTARYSGYCVMIEENSNLRVWTDDNRVYPYVNTSIYFGRYRVDDLSTVPKDNLDLLQEVARQHRKQTYRFYVVETDMQLKPKVEKYISTHEHREIKSQDPQQRAFALKLTERQCFLHSRMRVIPDLLSQKQWLAYTLHDIEQDFV